jgi:hypothetical protein
MDGENKTILALTNEPIAFLRSVGISSEKFGKRNALP